MRNTKAPLMFYSSRSIQSIKQLFASNKEQEERMRSDFSESTEIDNSKGIFNVFCFTKITSHHWKFSICTLGIFIFYS